MMRFTLLAVLFLVASVRADDAPREIVMEAKKVDGAVHWLPAKVEVTQGEKLKIVAKWDEEGGFDFHGLFIPVLKVTTQVDRHKAKELEVTVPKTLKAGEYKIGCQFHEKHVPATLVVKAAPKTTAKAVPAPKAN